MQWALKNREEAVEVFKISAKEVITILKNIEQKLVKEG